MMACNFVNLLQSTLIDSCRDALYERLKVLNPFSTINTFKNNPNHKLNKCRDVLYARLQGLIVANL